MTASGGRYKDPTNVTGVRVGAYLIDAVLASVLMLGFLWVFEFSNYRTSDRQNVEAAGQYCTDMNQPGPFPGTPYDIGPELSHPDAEFCFAFGTQAYILLGDEVATAQLHVVGYSLGLSLLYWVILPAATGATLGKRLFGLRVVMADGTRAGFVPSAIRWAVLVVDGAFCGIVGFIVMSVSRGHRRLGDMAAGTYVVRKVDVGRPVLETVEPAPPPRPVVPVPLGLQNPFMGGVPGADTPPSPPPPPAPTAEEEPPA